MGFCDLVTEASASFWYDTDIKNENKRSATRRFFYAVMNITSENFEQEIMGSDRPVLLDFWASWCGPCRMVSPIVDEIAEDHPEIRVGKINVDEQPELAGQFGVMSIPSLFYMENGKVVRKTMGAMPKQQILKFIGK